MSLIEVITGSLSLLCLGAVFVFFAVKAFQDVEDDKWFKIIFILHCSAMAISAIIVSVSLWFPRG